MNKKEEFLNAFERAINTKTLSYVVVAIELANGSKKLDVTSERLHEAIDYYNNLYDDDLHFIHSQKIRIVGYLFV